MSAGTETAKNTIRGRKASSDKTRKAVNTHQSDSTMEREFNQQTTAAVASAAAQHPLSSVFLGVHGLMLFLSSFSSPPFFSFP